MWTLHLGLNWSAFFLCGDRPRTKTIWWQIQPVKMYFLVPGGKQHIPLKNVQLWFIVVVGEPGFQSRPYLVFYVYLCVLSWSVCWFVFWSVCCAFLICVLVFVSGFLCGESIAAVIGDTFEKHECCVSSLMLRHLQTGSDFYWLMHKLIQTVLQCLGHEFMTSHNVHHSFQEAVYDNMQNRILRVCDVDQSWGDGWMCFIFKELGLSSHTLWTPILKCEQ